MEIITQKDQNKIEENSNKFIIVIVKVNEYHQIVIKQFTVSEYEG